jgi:hypothetical protein
MTPRQCGARVFRALAPHPRRARALHSSRSARYASSAATKSGARHSSSAASASGLVANFARESTSHCVPTAHSPHERARPPSFWGRCQPRPQRSVQLASAAQCASRQRCSASGDSKSAASGCWSASGAHSAHAAHASPSSGRARAGRAAPPAPRMRPRSSALSARHQARNSGDWTGDAQAGTGGAPACADAAALRGIARPSRSRWRRGVSAASPTRDTPRKSPRRVARETSVSSLTCPSAGGTHPGCADSPEPVNLAGRARLRRRHGPDAAAKGARRMDGAARALRGRARVGRRRAAHGWLHAGPAPPVVRAPGPAGRSGARLGAAHRAGARAPRPRRAPFARGSARGAPGPETAGRLAPAGAPAGARSGAGGAARGAGGAAARGASLPPRGGPHAARLAAAPPATNAP